MDGFDDFDTQIQSDEFYSPYDDYDEHEHDEYFPDDPAPTDEDISVMYRFFHPEISEEY